jgi:hypothetical protein
MAQKRRLQAVALVRRLPSATSSASRGGGARSSSAWRSAATFDPLLDHLARGWLDALKKVGSFTESGSRIGEFKATYKPGDFESALQAAFNSREVSTDFGMRGGNTRCRSGRASCRS